MTQGIHDFQSKAYGAYLPSSPVGYDKAYGQDGSYIKNLGGANPELTNYYENQLLPYWQAVQSGEIQISQQDFAQLQQWMQYCQYELGLASSAWGNSGFGHEMEGTEDKGPVQNGTYTDAENEFTVDGSVPTSDVWGNATLNVPPPCTATFETTTDNRFNPPETVVKAIITNPAMKGPDGGSAVSVVYIHDGGKITCNGSKKGDGTSRISDSTGTVTIGEYQAKAEDAKPESSIAGVKDEVTGEINYESESWEDWIEFYPQPGENQVHNFYGNANINAKASDKIDIVCHQDGSVTVTVTHLDQSTDIYNGQDGCSLNINGNPVNITANGGELSGGIPEEFFDRIQINGEQVDKASGGTEASQIIDGLLEVTGKSPEELLSALKSAGFSEFLGISDPEEAMEKLEELISEGKFPGELKDNFNKLFEFLRYFDEDNLTGINYGDNKEVKAYYVRLADLLTILLPGKEIELEMDDVMSNDFNAALFIDGHKYMNSHNSTSTKEEKSSDETQDKADNIKASDILNNVPDQGGAPWNTPEALDLAGLIGDALHNGNWDDVIKYFNDGDAAGWNGGNKNNIIRKVITALYKAAGSNNDVFMALLDKIPDDVLKTMKDWVKSNPDGINEAGEKGAGDQWNSAATAAKIQEAIDYAAD